MSEWIMARVRKSLFWLFIKSGAEVLVITTGSISFQVVRLPLREQSVVLESPSAPHALHANRSP